MGTNKLGRLVGSLIENISYPCLACSGRAVALPETHIGDQARRGVPCGGASLGSSSHISDCWVQLIER